MRVRRVGYAVGMVAVCTVGALVGAPVAAAPATLKVMSWNACADAPTTTYCSQAAYTSKVATNIDASISRHPGLDAVLLQEVCSVDVSRLRTLRPHWRFEFTPIWYGRSDNRRRYPCRDDRSTGKSRGYFGIAVGVRSTTVTFRHWYYNARPDWNGWHAYQVTQALICASVPAFGTKICGTHLTPTPSHMGSGSDRHVITLAEKKVFWRIQEQQARGIRLRVGTSGRVIAGGDLNVPAPDSLEGKTIDPNGMVTLYDGYRECDQSRYGGLRNGRGTYQRQTGGIAKLDYVFAAKSATVSCYVTGKHVYTSDHRSITATITF